MSTFAWFSSGNYSWQSEALCRDADPDLFFHPEEERGSARRIRQQRAKRICSNCPVLFSCRHFAVNSHEVYGIWGGLTEEDRRSCHSAG